MIKKIKNFLDKRQDERRTKIKMARGLIGKKPEAVTSPIPEKEDEGDKTVSNKVEIITENQLISIRLDEITKKLYELEILLLKIAKGAEIDIS